ncbi:hypothetical protein ACHQM5_029425 [Ranunculus cassubicifolius]
MINLRSMCLFVVIALVCSIPPEDPVKCSLENQNCTVTNSIVIYPSTEEELVDVVAKASLENKKMKVVTKCSYSHTKLVCPDSKDGLLISTRYLNRIIEVNALSRTMTVESGVTIRELIDQAAKAGLALPSTPYWWGLTLGGVLGTGAHGSTLFGNGSAVHDYVVGLRLVIPAGPDEGYSKVIVLDNSHPDMDAAKLSLGVLGVISQVTLELQLLFKRSVRISVEDDLDLAERVTYFGQQHEFADITWYPGQREAVYKIDDRVSDDVSDDDRVSSRSFISFRSDKVNKDTQQMDLHLLGTLLLATITIYNLLDLVLIAITTGKSRHALGIPESMVNFFHITTFSIGFSNVKNFIKDVKKFRDLEPSVFCGVDLYNGILMRYVKASSAYLGKEEDGVDFDMTYYRSKNPLVPKLHEDILEELEQLAFFNYGGLPHWSKNRHIAFNGVIKKYSRGKKFLEVKEKYDPMGLFSSEWTNQVLEVEGDVNIMRDGCALEGLCICSEDRHCAPDRGYGCRPGRLYEDARVCICTKINLHG